MEMIANYEAISTGWNGGMRDARSDSNVWAWQAVFSHRMQHSLGRKCLNAYIVEITAINRVSLNVNSSSAITVISYHIPHGWSHVSVEIPLPNSRIFYAGSWIIAAWLTWQTVYQCQSLSQFWHHPLGLGSCTRSSSSSTATDNALSTNLGMT